MNDKNSFYSEKGITLVELIVAVAIMSIIILALTQLFLDGVKLFSRGEEKSQNQMQIRLVTDEITKDLRYAKDLEMLLDTEIPSSPPTDPEQQKYKYIYFKKNASDYSLFTLEHIDGNWLTNEYLKGRIKEPDNDNNYFQLQDKSVEFDVTDKAIKHEDSRRFKLKTTVNLLNTSVGEQPKDPDKQVPPNKYRGIKYKN